MVDPNLIEDIDDLILQATTERSHYYTKRVLERCRAALLLYASKKNTDVAIKEIKHLIEKRFAAEPHKRKQKWLVSVMSVVEKVEEKYCGKTR